MAIIIGIGGGSGSGKTTLSDILKKKFKDISYLSYDSYYNDLTNLPLDKRKTRNFDQPESLDEKLFVKHLTDLKNGKDINKPVYDFSIHSRSDKTELVKSGDIIIVEGILIFHSKELRDLFDIKIYVDADSDTRLSRRIVRDVNERGRTVQSVITQYLETVKPMFEQYVEPTKRYCDIIVPNDIHSKINSNSIKIIELYINSCLKPKLN
jgi:uridine kinase